MTPKPHRRPSATKPREEHLKVAVIADLHAYDHRLASDKADPSHLCTLNDEGQPGTHPITALKQTIEKEALVADILLCAGDLGDKANKTGIVYAWRAVHEIASTLSARLVAGTVGNHDINSRYNDGGFDLKGNLQSLIPPFPLPDEADNDRFWSRNFAVVEHALFRLIVLNSSAFHGGQADEIEHGRISDRTITALDASLTSATPRPVNLLLCHHHPHKHSELKLGEFDEMRGGQELLDYLGSGDVGEWIVIHGHKHHPKLTYAAGGTSAPIVFSAGSLCAKLYPELGSRVRNQFYIIDFPIHRLAQLGLVGTFKAWDWHSGIGWQPAQISGSGLPGTGGFGFRGNVGALAAKVAELVRDGERRWAGIIASIEGLTYLMPRDTEALFQHLKQTFKLNLLRDDGQRPVEIGEAYE